MKNKPESVVLIFDGDCGFCTSTANYIQKNSSTSIKIVAWQLTPVAAFGLSSEQTAKKVYLNVDGMNFSGHKAFARLLQLQSRWYLKLLGVIMLIPPISWLARLGYLLVARYRHKLPGGTPACELQKTIR